MLGLPELCVDQLASCRLPVFLCPYVCPSSSLQVMDVVRVAEQLTSRPSSQNSNARLSSPTERKASAETKMTTVVLGKHTLAQQSSTVSTAFLVAGV